MSLITVLIDLHWFVPTGVVFCLFVSCGTALVMRLLNVKPTMVGLIKVKPRKVKPRGVGFLHSSPQLIRGESAALYYNTF